MDIFLVADDFGESECLEKIANAFHKRGHTTTKFLGFGKKLVLTDSVLRQALKANILLASISGDSEMERHLTSVVRQHTNMPVVVYSINKYAFRNEKATALREIADVLLVSSEDEIPEARTLFSNAKKIEAIGNIMHEDYYPALSRFESRKIAGVSEEQKLIFVPGDKCIGINWPLFYSVIEAAHCITVQIHTPVVSLGIHPGDATYRREIYSDLVKYSRGVPVKIYTRDVLNSSILVTACDLLVTACSSLAVAAAFQRKPIIGFFFENMLAEYEDVYGTFKWEPAENESALVVRSGSIDSLSRAMHSLLLPHSSDSRYMKKKQEDNYPAPPALGSTAKKAVDIILQTIVR